MSVRVDHLPGIIRETLNGEHLEDKVGSAYLFVTTDIDMTPRPCMLSVGEVLVTGPSSYRLAVWTATRTAANLRTGRPVLFCFVDRDAVIHVTGRPRPLPPVEEFADEATDGSAEGIERFEVVVDEVSFDAHEGLPVSAPITYRCAGLSKGELVNTWQRQLAALRA